MIIKILVINKQFRLIMQNTKEGITKNPKS